ncbi:glutathione S-transferase family protein [Methylobacterium symbioticum]|uniref:Disulfide-bond oxidoreductase YfcG n=1 Tax=Methylobacterium symbioticum TaxID=2584084 RepID=A0A509EJ26_9HYPH|nr:glutathione S-transferase family protein [Methylobacterium symbioticum]VUD74377.1 Disulfide-bond oxidoreductase YfcG [Methylobacterium symbioticum]
MLTLFHAPRSRSTRILWLLEELGAAYAVRYVGIRYGDGSGDGPDPENRHPDKKVPALDHDGTIVSESTAVAIHLCDLAPAAGLLPAAASPERGACLTWLCWADNELGAAVMQRMMGGGADPRAQAGYDAAVRRLTEALARGPYLMGARFTVADVMIAPLLRFARAQLPDSAAIDAYLARATDRPAFARAMAKDAPAAQAAA